MAGYRAYTELRQACVRIVGYAGTREIPDDLLRGLAGFLDVHPDDSMTAYYANALLDQFYRRRTAARTARLFQVLNTHLENKRVLLDVALRRPDGSRVPLALQDSAVLWPAIRELPDGYGKANAIGTYAHLFPDAAADAAFEAVMAMPEPFRTRALGGIHPRMDAPRRAHILAELCAQFAAGSHEAAYRLKTLFPILDRAVRRAVVALHLDTDGVPESLIAYLVIRNAQYLCREDAKRVAARAGRFESDYLRIRCLLKLARHLPVGQVDALYRRFQRDLVQREPVAEDVHNLLQFGATMPPSGHGDIVAMALALTARIDDRHSAHYEQGKYGLMMFMLPLLGETHREAAQAVADTVRGGYGKGLRAKLRRHDAGGQEFCTIRRGAIMY